MGALFSFFDTVFFFLVRKKTVKVDRKTRMLLPVSFVCLYACRIYSWLLISCCNHRPVGLWALNSVQDILGWVLKQIACDLLPDCTEGQLRTAGIQKPGQVNQEQVGNTNLRKSCFLGLRTYNLQF